MAEVTSKPEFFEGPTTRPCFLESAYLPLSFFGTSLLQPFFFFLGSTELHFKKLYLGGDNSA